VSEVPGVGTLAGVAYDEELADRIRDLLAGDRTVTEKRMFGGLAFLVDGKMAVAASSQGGLLARIDPAQHDRLTRGAHVAAFVMRGRPMDGWLHVDSEAVRTTRQLRTWVERCGTYARSLPPRRPRRAASR
jgi:TfoX/Sxy family transcriptional regulator of competence genes